MRRSWVRCDLPKKTADVLKKYLKATGVKYECSENGDDIHFECFMSLEEQFRANSFIDKNC